MTERGTRRLVGHVGVDAGMVLVVDPCYLSEWAHGHYDIPRHEAGLPARNSYERVARAMLDAPDRAAGVDFAGRGNPHLAVVSETGHGDGTYPVYAEYDDSFGRRVARLVVEFIADPCDEIEFEEDADADDPRWPTGV